MSSSSPETWAQLREALGDEPLPAALCMLDALEANAAALFALARAGGKKLRIATKSVRCPELLSRLLTIGGGDSIGLMTFAASETAWLAERGHRDLLLAYPTLHPRDCEMVAEANHSARAAVAVDGWEQVEALARAGAAAGVRVPLVIDVDASYRPLELKQLHLGVRRSPLREARAIADLAEKIASHPDASFAGLLSYEAQVAGLPDRGAGFLVDAAVGAMKRRSLAQLLDSRAALVRELESRRLKPALFNGGGTGSLAQAARDPSLTELTAGSGFFKSHLFDHIAPREGAAALRPALSFALQATRRPAPDLITCAGGGIVASGEAGASRLPRPWLPEGLSLLPREGAGEVQTPLRVPAGLEIPLGAPVFFRPAKAGEPLERFNELLLLRAGRIESRAKTYRGLGLAFG